MHLDEAYLGNQNTVTLGHTHGHAVSIFAQGAGSNGENLAFIELLDAGLWQKDAASSLGLGLDALDQNAVQERDEGLDGSDRGSLYRRGKSG